MSARPSQPHRLRDKIDHIAVSSEQGELTAKDEDSTSLSMSAPRQQKLSEPDKRLLEKRGSKAAILSDPP
jgi:hypothetical protein